MTEFNEPIKKPEQITYSRESSMILLAAQQEAQGLNHIHVTPEHLLKALIKDPIIEAVLSRIYTTPDEIRSFLDFLTSYNPTRTTPYGRDENRSLPSSPSLKMVIDMARDGTKRTNRQEINPLDLLIGIICEGELAEIQRKEIRAAALALKRIGFGYDNISMVERIYENIKKEYKEK